MTLRPLAMFSMLGHVKYRICSFIPYRKKKLPPDIFYILSDRKAMKI